MPKKREQLIDELIPIFRDVFDDDTVTVNAATTAADVDGWDSLTHIRLILAIEKAYKMRFTAAEISDLANVGEMADLIAKKQVDA